jgi:hypothetical protein
VLLTPTLTVRASTDRTTPPPQETR